jgi:hypothetical protein
MLSKCEDAWLNQQQQQKQLYSIVYILYNFNFHKMLCKGNNNFLACIKFLQKPNKPANQNKQINFILIFFFNILYICNQLYNAKCL